MTQLLQEYPAIWSVGGMAVASFIFWITSRQVFKMQRVASENLVATLEKQINHIEAEREDYKNKLHAEKNGHQATNLSIAELEARPNLATLEMLLKQYGDGIKTISNTLMSHVESDAKVFGAMQASLAIIPAAIKEQSDIFRQGQKELLNLIGRRRSK